MTQSLTSQMIDGVFPPGPAPDLNKLVKRVGLVGVSEMIHYAGIGSRQTPGNILDLMQGIGRHMSHKGYTLRSGGARGADSAFEQFAKLKEIFTAYDSQFHPQWFTHASRYHPRWGKLNERAKELHARNSAIILGANLDSPVDFVVCWTADGRASGGTGQALRIAEDLKIPVYNLYDIKRADALWFEWGNV